MKEFLHLFTPVTEALPELSTASHVVFKYEWAHEVHHNNTMGIYRGIRNGLHLWEILYADGWKPEVDIVTHWLDLSKLTTKERAENFAEQCAGYSYSIGLEKLYYELAKKEVRDYINENKGNL